MNTLLLNQNYRNLSEQKQLLISNQYLNLRKKKPYIYLFIIFLGGFGAHHYYMGNVGAGITYTLICWTFIPAIIAFLELFWAYTYVNNYNEKLVRDLIISNP